MTLLLPVRRDDLRRFVGLWEAAGTRPAAPGLTEVHQDVLEMTLPVPSGCRRLDGAAG